MINQIVMVGVCVTRASLYVMTNISREENVTIVLENLFHNLVETYRKSKF